MLLLVQEWYVLSTLAKTSPDDTNAKVQFHRGEYSVRDVKEYLASHGFHVRHE